MQCACGDKTIVAADKADDLRLVEAVALHRKRIDDHLHQFLACTDEIDFQNAAVRFEFFLQTLRNSGQRTLRHVAGQIQNQHRIEARHLHFVNGRFIRLARQLGLGQVDFLAHIL